jgi:cellulose synthase/poly-beta-1,6-N-acetylglucosamine synthase-like glycosyltransferase
MGVDGGMYLLRKNLFQSLPPDTILDDFAISLQVMRSGHRIIYDSDIKAKESGTPSSKQEFQRRVRMMAGVVQLLRRGNVPRLSQPILWFQFISHKLLRWITPLLVMALLFTTALLALGSSAYGFLFALQICVYAFFMLTVMVVPVRNHRLGSIVFYFFMSQVAIVIGIWKGVRNRQRVLWDKGRRASATVSA